MEVSKWLGMFEQFLHVTEIRQQSPVSHYPTVLTLDVREYHLDGCPNVINGLTDGSVDLLILIVEHTSPLVWV